MWYTKFLVFNTYFICRLLFIQLLSLLLLQLLAVVKTFLPVSQSTVTTAVAVVKTVLPVSQSTVTAAVAVVKTVHSLDFLGGV